MMYKMGFAPMWIDIIMTCVTTASFTVKLNGGLFRCFLHSRGLQRGDPLSPYLFHFFVEGLSALLRKAQVDNQIKGVSFGGTGPRITHLLFADNSIVFLEGTEDSMRALGDILVR